MNHKARLIQHSATNTKNTPLGPLISRLLRNHLLGRKSLKTYLTSFTGKRSKMKASSGFTAYLAQLVHLKQNGKLFAYIYYDIKVDNKFNSKKFAEHTRFHMC